MYLFFKILECWTVRYWNKGTSPVPECSGTRLRSLNVDAGGIGLDAMPSYTNQILVVLLHENLRTYFELSV